MLSVRHISKNLGALSIKDVSFDVQPGQYFVLLGASGVGKSVLLQTIAGITSPDTGCIFLDEKDITCEKIYTRKIALVFQNNTLFPHLTVYDNIAYPLRCQKLENRQIRERIDKLAEDFAINHLLKQRTTTLSGGEAQRVSLARAIASEPKCLLLDEPLSSLDVKSRSQIRALLRKLSARSRAIVHVTHDYTEAACLGTHIAVMENGRLAQTGTLQEVFQRPKSEFIARFVGIRNFFKGRLLESDYRRDSRAGSRQFVSNGLSFSLLTDRPAQAGFICVRSEDVTIYNGTSPLIRPRSSARNNFEGTIVDIVPNGAGVEVIVDIAAAGGVELAALITNESVRMLDLHCGKKVWVSFKASAVKYVEQGDTILR